MTAQGGAEGREVTHYFDDEAAARAMVKWPRAAASHRRSTAESRGAPSNDEIRQALYAWSFNKSRREAGPHRPTGIHYPVARHKYGETDRA
jgi:hypothetical protein